MSNYSYAAVIVETRDIDIETVISEHVKYLSDDWKVIIQRDLPISNRADYNVVLTSESFWESLICFNRVLIFQHDSGLLRKGIEEFLQWDYRCTLEGNSTLGTSQ